MNGDVRQHGTCFEWDRTGSHCLEVRCDQNSGIREAESIGSYGVVKTRPPLPDADIRPHSVATATAYVPTRRQRYRLPARRQCKRQVGLDESDIRDAQAARRMRRLRRAISRGPLDRPGQAARRGASAGSPAVWRHDGAREPADGRIHPLGPRWHRAGLRAHADALSAREETAWAPRHALRRRAANARDGARS